MIDHALGDAEELIAEGPVRSEDPGRPATPFRLVVASSTLRTGRGPIALTWNDGTIAIDGGTLIWIVTTNKGWAHLRGIASSVDPPQDLPFRADLYSSGILADGAPDRLALRFYPQGADPNLDSPIHKFQGTFESGGVHLFGG